MATGKQEDEFDWRRTWAGDMMLTRSEKDRLRGITPEAKRLREIKAGIITASAGAGLMILLFVLMSGIVAGGVSDKAATILSRLWIVGIVPLFVGIALIINGMFITPWSGDGSENETDAGTSELPGTTAETYLPPADTNDQAPTPFSVTEGTTKHLKTPRQ